MNVKGLEKGTVSKYLEYLVSITPKTQREIAKEIGIKSNLFSMWKRGETKVPFRMVEPLAKALNADPVYLSALMLAEYEPERYALIKRYLGGILPKDERELVNTIRDAKDSSGLEELPEQKIREIAEAIRAVMKKEVA